MPISASSPIASSRRFATETWFLSVLAVPSPRLPGPTPSRASDIYRFAVEEKIENGDRAHATLDHTAPGKVSGVEMTPRADHVVPVPTIRIVRHALSGDSSRRRTPGSRSLEAHRR